EILSGELGSQNAVCGGGRYDNLAEAIGGPHIPAVGFAAGVDRIIMVMEQQGCSFGDLPPLDAFVVAQRDSFRTDVLRVAEALRRSGLSAETDLGGRSMKAQMKAASSRGARYACIIGESERQNGTATVKDMATAEQREIDQSSLAEELKSKSRGLPEGAFNGRRAAIFRHGMAEDRLLRRRRRGEGIRGPSGRQRMGEAQEGPRRAYIHRPLGSHWDRPGRLQPGACERCPRTCKGASQRVRDSGQGKGAGAPGGHFQPVDEDGRLGDNGV
ncbi:MAG: hypothetical protein GX181_08770, partial [Synergistaceae bacterium]|nr:hypothetical protein [Synergistaceae bacterium]